MDKDFTMKHSLELMEKAHPTRVEVIDGWLLPLRNVMEEIHSLEVMLGDQVSHVVFQYHSMPCKYNGNWSSMV
jgi:hypothetical protein